MNGFNIIEFIIRNDKDTINLEPLNKSMDYFNKLIDADQYVIVKKDGILVGFATYYKVDNLKEVLETNETWELPNNYTQGKIMFVDTLVTKKINIPNGVIFQITKALKDKEPGTTYGAFIKKGRKVIIKQFKRGGNYV